MFIYILILLYSIFLARSCTNYMVGKTGDPLIFELLLLSRNVTVLSTDLYLNNRYLNEIQDLTKPNNKTLNFSLINTVQLFSEIPYSENLFSIESSLEIAKILYRYQTFETAIESLYIVENVSLKLPANIIGNRQTIEISKLILGLRGGKTNNPPLFKPYQPKRFLDLLKKKPSLNTSGKKLAYYSLLASFFAFMIIYSFKIISSISTAQMKFSEIQLNLFLNELENYIKMPLSSRSAVRKIFSLFTNTQKLRKFIYTLSLKGINLSPLSAFGLSLYSYYIQFMNVDLITSMLVILFTSIGSLMWVLASSSVLGIFILGFLFTFLLCDASFTYLAGDFFCHYFLFWILGKTLLIFHSFFAFLYWLANIFFVQVNEKVSVDDPLPQPSIDVARPISNPTINGPKLKNFKDPLKSSLNNLPIIDAEIIIEDFKLPPFESYEMSNLIEIDKASKTIVSKIINEGTKL